MPRCSPTRRLVVATLALALLLQSTSCGTLMHPERRGQPAGRLDPAIVTLNAVGLLLFFVPGVIAFAVDFSNGTIYLPPDSYVQASGEQGELQMLAIQADPAELSQQRIEQIVQQHTGKPVQLQAGGYRATRLNNIDEFRDHFVELAQGPPSRGTAHVLLRCQSE